MPPNFSMPSIDERLGFYKIVNYNYFPGWHQQATTFELLINKDVWETLTDRQRAVFELSSQANVVNGIAIGESSQGPTLQRKRGERCAAADLASGNHGKFS